MLYTGCVHAGMGVSACWLLVGQNTDSLNPNPNPNPPDCHLRRGLRICQRHHRGLRPHPAAAVRPGPGAGRLARDRLRAVCGHDIGDGCCSRRRDFERRWVRWRGRWGGQSRRACRLWAESGGSTLAPAAAHRCCLSNHPSLMIGRAPRRRPRAAGRPVGGRVPVQRRVVHCAVRGMTAFAGRLLTAVVSRPMHLSLPAVQPTPNHPTTKQPSNQPTNHRNAIIPRSSSRSPPSTATAAARPR